MGRLADRLISTESVARRRSDVKGWRGRGGVSVCLVKRGKIGSVVNVENLAIEDQGRNRLHS